MKRHVNNRSRIDRQGYKVLAPKDKNRDGNWSKQKKILAKFLNRSDSYWYCTYIKEKYPELPIRLKTPEDENFDVVEREGGVKFVRSGI